MKKPTDSVWKLTLFLLFFNWVGMLNNSLICIYLGDDGKVREEGGVTTFELKALQENV